MRAIRSGHAATRTNELETRPRQIRRRAEAFCSLARPLAVTAQDSSITLCDLHRTLSTPATTANPAHRTLANRNTLAASVPRILGTLKNIASPPPTLPAGPRRTLWLPARTLPILKSIAARVDPLVAANE